MHLLKPKQSRAATPEALFAEKYNWLLKWALHFAQGNQSEAEDLVQDTFVRFVLSERELKDPERIEPLLYTYLKFVHLSHIRRSQRYPHQELPLVDFDSIDLAIRETPSIDPIEVQDTLRRIVGYLIWRKEKAKSASILLLRFFHGYRKDEIIRIGVLSDRVVANSLMSAREETREYLGGGREHLRLIDQAAPTLSSSGVAVEHDQLLAELRRSIVESRQGACLPREQLLLKYQEVDPKPIECKLLAHIVSCERCLDIVSKLHGFPPLSGRSSEDVIEAARRTRFGLRTRSSAAEDRPQRVLRTARHRLGDVYDHQPKQLVVAVNGHIIASRDVGSAVNKLEVEINHETKIEFIEVFSEQGICLLAMPVEAAPPEAPPELHHEVGLTHGRTVGIILRFTGVGPLVHVSYSDPALAFSSSYPIEGEVDFASSNSVLDAIPEPRRKESEMLRTWSSPQSSGVLQLFRWSLMNTLFASGVVLTLATVLCSFLWMRQQPEIPTANELLAKAEASDSSLTKSNQPGIVQQQVLLEIPGKAFEHTLYRDAQGVRKPKSPVPIAGEEQWAARLATAHVPLEDPLSAASYQHWHDSQRIRHDEVTRLGRNLLSLKTTMPQGEVAQETLTVRESDFHPVERTVMFRDSGTVQIAELEYKVLPWQPASEGWFEPLASNSVGSGASPPPAGLRLPHVLTENELDEVELSARLALNQIGADTNDRIDLIRFPTGIQVKGIVATDSRKREIEGRLRSIAHIVPAIFTFQELQAGAGTGEPTTTLKQSSVVAELTPLEQDLLARGMSREDVGRLADQLFDASASISQSSNAINALLQNFAEKQQLSDSSRVALQQLVASHEKKILAALQAEERFLAQTGALKSQPPDVRDTTLDFKAAAEKNVELCRELVGNGVAQPRSAQVILSELIASSAQLRESMLHLPVERSHQ